MIEPSSSEEDEEEVPDAPQTKRLDVPNGNASGPRSTTPNANDLPGMKDVKNGEKVTSPTLSQNSEKNLTEAEIKVRPLFFSSFDGYLYVSRELS